MHGYDTVLKTLLQLSANSIIEQIADIKVARWLNVELPEVRQSRVDFLGESLEGELIHIELQSTNDPQIPLRMAEYSLRVYRLFQRFPRQILLYVGSDDMRMASALVGPQHVCRYTIVDIRDLDSEVLLNSPFIADNVMAILTNLRDRKAAVRQVLSRIGELSREQRDAALSEFLILSGLRKLETVIVEEVQQMPILTDILDHEILGPAIREGRERGIQEGRERGIQEGRERGIQEGERSVLRRLIQKRFGEMPDWAEERLTQLSVPELEELSLRVLEARDIREFFAG